MKRIKKYLALIRPDKKYQRNMKVLLNTKTSYFYLENGHIVAVGHLEAMNGFGGYGKVPYYFEFNEDLTVNWWNYIKYDLKMTLHTTHKAI